MMRVITGIAKGIRLETMEGLDVRPTTDKVKEAIFSSIQFELYNSDVLDLFAGSGQLGIEALSRGAQSAVFIDNSKKSIELVKNPPYNKGILTEILPLLSDKLNYNGKIICEYEQNLILPEKIVDLILKKNYKYGKINISMFCRYGEDE